MDPAVEEYLRQLRDQRDRQSMGYTPSTALADANDTNAFLAQLDRSASQIGSVKGKQAGSTLGDYANQLAASNAGYQKELDTSNKFAQTGLAGAQQVGEELYKGGLQGDKIAFDTEDRKAKLQSQENIAKANQDATQNYRNATLGLGYANLNQRAQQNQENSDLKRELTTAKQDSAVPKDQQNLISGLSTKNADKISIKNQLDQELQNMKNSWAKGDEDQAVAAGENMLKVLNSTEGKDAVGAEESKRLAAFLNYKIFNYKEPGSFMGRDVEEFMKQAADKSTAIGQAVVENNNMIQRIKSGAGLPTQFTDQTKDIPRRGSENGKAMAAPTGSSQLGMPKVGDILNGHKYLGGDPKSATSWEEE